MSELLIKTEAIKLVNKGGGYKLKTVTENFKDAYGKEMSRHHHEISEKKEKGSDYVVFNCPWPDCGKRNRQTVFMAKQITEEKNLTFRCWSCRREIEVMKPKEIPTIVVPTMERNEFRSLYGPNNKPIRKENRQYSSPLDSPVLY